MDAPHGGIVGGPTSLLQAPSLTDSNRGILEARVVIAGYGGVGRELARLLTVKSEALERLYGVRVRVLGVVDSRDAAVCSRSMVSSGPCGRPEAVLDYVYAETHPSVHIEVTLSDYRTGEPGLSHAFKALRSGASFVAANKAPLALRFWEIAWEAEARGLYLGYKVTVMAGTPFVSLLRGYDAKSFEGVLNATTNYILTLMHERLVPVQEALETAKAEGVAEPDPSLDIEEWDPAAKLVMVANALGYRLMLGGIRREPLRVTLEDVGLSDEEGDVLRYVARLRPKEGRAEVALSEVGRDRFLEQAWGAMNAAVVNTGFNEIKLMGSGGETLATAYALLSDVVETVRGWLVP